MFLGSLLYSSHYLVHRKGGLGLGYFPAHGEQSRGEPLHPAPRAGGRVRLDDSRAAGVAHVDCWLARWSQLGNLPPRGRGACFRTHAHFPHHLIDASHFAGATEADCWKAALVWEMAEAQEAYGRDVTAIEWRGTV